MKALKLLVCLMIVGIIVGAFFTESHAACVCNEKGRDYCQACTERRIIRPKQRYYGTADSDLNLTPIGDNCWCSKLMVEPAALPKPCTKKKPSTPSKPTSSCGCNTYADTVNIHYPTPDVGYASSPDTAYPSGSAYGSGSSLDKGSSKTRDESQAADPISVSLATQAGKAIEVPEAKLAYGFLQKPVDGLKKIYFSTVPEENLFKLNSDVITLKKRTESSTKEEDDEWHLALEESEGDEDDSTDEEDRPQLTYKQLGYVTEKFKNPKFRRLSASTYRDDGESEETDRRKPVRGRGSVDCGFRAGGGGSGGGRGSNYRKKNNKVSGSSYSESY